MSAWSHAGLDPLPGPPGSIAALVGNYARAEASPVEVLERLAQRLARGAFGAAEHSPFSGLCLERARPLAEASARRWREGSPLGPLDGVPIPLKDQHDIAGLPTGCGAPGRAQPAERDGELIELLEGAGALVPGKTHSTEWGLCPAGRSSHLPLPAHPLDPSRAPGGSSTGAGVAVSLGLVPAALGSDGGGSLRIPAALLGLFALKPPAPGRRLRGDHFARGSLTAGGPLAGCTRDLLPLLALLGHQVDPAALGRGLRGCRIGLPVEAWSMAQAETARRGEGLLARLEGRGATLVPCSAPLLLEARALGVAVVLAEGALALGQARELGRLSAAAARSLEDLMRGPWPSPGRIPAARRCLCAQLSGLFEGLDLLALPTTLGPSPARALPDEGARLLSEADDRRLCASTFAANLCGLPAGSVPAGRVNGLPVGLQIVGPPDGTGGVLAAMAAAERAGVERVVPPGFEAPEGAGA
jgi:Asp-tRNA(Asn)/Glu-tRNA(Gln) amidotransferase A subunit family amidase